jgi:hypothetical protein
LRTDTVKRTIGQLAALEDQGYRSQDKEHLAKQDAIRRKLDRLDEHQNQTRRLLAQMEEVDDVMRRGSALHILLFNLNLVRNDKTRQQILKKEGEYIYHTG